VSGNSQTLLILGASGDLTRRLLLPGFGSLVAAGYADSILLLGTGSDELDEQEWKARVSGAFAEAGQQGPAIDRVVEQTRYTKADVTATEDLRELIESCEGDPILYFALPPSVAVTACEAFRDVDLPERTRLVMEKPFGTDLESARALNELLTSLVPEESIHRVDHFLGLSTVLNIVGLRFANRLLEPVLNSTHVESVEIVWDEDLGLEGRARYYDRAGALVDMIQSHLLQVLSLLTMEAPVAINAQDFRDEKAQALRATRVWKDDPASASRRARYTAGTVEGRDLPDYAAEDGVDPALETETLAEIVVGVDNWRWSGVPFRLRSGKALGNPRKEAVITFRPTPHLPEGLTGVDLPDRLRIGLGFGADRLRLDLNINGPGNPGTIDAVTLEAEFGAGELPEYGEVLRGVLRDDPTLSVRGDTAEQCWRIIEPVQQAWKSGEVPLEQYPAGSPGPEGWPDGPAQPEIE
jgi:glucose-6-phosphate 1-dehydrogenase